MRGGLYHGPKRAGPAVLTRSEMRRAGLSTLLFLFGAQAVFAGSLVHVGTLAAERIGASATLLDDGRVLVAGGNSMERRLEVFDLRSGHSTKVTWRST